MGGEEEEGQVSDLIEDEASASPDTEIENLMNKERVANLLEVMTEREKHVLDMRYGLADSQPSTLAEVAKLLGVSRERVRQIEESALLKLRKFVKKHKQEI